MQDKLYKILIALNLIVFVGFGLRVGIPAIAQRSMAIKQLTQLKTDMQTKLDDLSQIANQYKSVQPYIAALDAALPSTTDMHTYLLSLVDALSAKGFILAGYYAGSVSTGSHAGATSIDLSIVGDPLKTAELVKTLEGLDRFTVVDSIRINFLDTSSIRASIFVYSGTGVSLEER